MFGLKTKVARAGAVVLLAGSLGVGAQAGDSVAEVTAVSDAFYASLNTMLAGTPVASEVAPLWLDAPGVTAQHPVGGRDTGLDGLLAAFDGVAGIASGGEVRIRDQAIAIFGDTAVETGTEVGTAYLAGEEVPLEYRVTNVYAMTGEGWRMVHHHTDLSQPILDLLSRLSQ